MSAPERAICVPGKTEQVAPAQAAPGRGVAMNRAVGCCVAALLWSCVLACTTASANATARSAGATDPSATDTAKAAIATLPDLGQDWTQYRKAGGAQKFGKNDCTIKAGSPVKPSDTGYVGPMYRDATKTMFAYSTSTVFRTEADAKAYTTVLTTPAFQTCKVGQDDKAQKKSDSTTFVKINDTATSAVGSPAGLDAYYSEYGGAKNAQGEDAPTAAYFRYTFRHGRVVYTLKIDTGLAADDAGSAALSDRIGQVIGDLEAAIEARLTAAGA
jgi:hypothetical protein